MAHARAAGRQKGDRRVSAWTLLKQTGIEFAEDKSPKHAAALAYSAIFALGPLLLVAVSVAGLVFGSGAQQSLLSQAESILGESGRVALESLLAGADRRGSGVIGLVVGSIGLLVAASGAMAALKDALNVSWEVDHRSPKGFKNKVKDFLKERGVATLGVLAGGALLMLSLAASTFTSLAQARLDGLLPGGALLWQALSLVVSLAVLALLFTLLFRELPDVDVAWRDAAMGGAVTAVLFVLGEFALSLYLSTSALATSYGAAGAVLVVLVWIYYSALIVLFGAEFTQVYANLYGRGMSPEADARTIQERVREEQAPPGNEGRDRVGRRGGDRGRKGRPG